MRSGGLRSGLLSSKTNLQAMAHDRDLNRVKEREREQERAIIIKLHQTEGANSRNNFSTSPAHHTSVILMLEVSKDAHTTFSTRVPNKPPFRARYWRHT